ncbi:hypothetical protein OZX60_02240 [Streptococcaceae bacterium ESL0687]|nr:hypothetical protein OZX60_02240 [Streptococcaceae bacterium ESL0687]
MSFTTYYMNEKKVYELALLINNKRTTEERTTEDKSNGAKGSGNADIQFQVPFLGNLGPKVKGEGEITRSSGQRREELSKIIYSQSILLREVVNKSVEKRNLSEAHEGDLVKIRNVEISLTNANDITGINILTAGVLSNLNESIDINKILEVFLKDSSYVFEGSSSTEKIMFNIPLTLEGELENNHHMSELELGRFTLVGIYKGKYQKKRIEEKLNRISYLNSLNQQNFSQDKAANVQIEKESDWKTNQHEISSGEEEVHYLDIISVIQESKFLK